MMRSRRSRKGRTGYWIAAAVFIILTLLPLGWGFIISITPQKEMFAPNVRFLPDHITWDNYKILFSAGSNEGTIFFAGMRNSIIAAVITTLICIPVSFLSAYVLTRTRFPGRKLILNSMLITMIIPVMATMAPIYNLYSNHGLLDHMTWLCLIYVTAFLPVLIWLIGNYLDTIPEELEEADMLDGCGRFQVLFHVILPISTPILLSSVLIIVLSTWNEFQIPLILASSMKTKPIAIVASEFASKDVVYYGMTAAAGMLSILPPALLAIIFKKYLIRGMARGAVKG